MRIFEKVLVLVAVANHNHNQKNVAKVEGLAVYNFRLLSEPPFRSTAARTMFLHSGTIVQLNEDGSDGQRYTAVPNQRTLTIGCSLRADVVLQSSNSDRPEPDDATPTTPQLEAADIFFEIVGDAFGKVRFESSMRIAFDISYS